MFGVCFFGLGLGFFSQIPRLLGSGLLDPMLGFLIFNWLKRDEFHLSQTHETSTHPPPLSTQERNRGTLTPQRLFCTIWRAFFSTFMSRH